MSLHHLKLRWLVPVGVAIIHLLCWTHGRERIPTGLYKYALTNYMSISFQMRPLQFFYDYILRRKLNASFKLMCQLTNWFTFI
jgi:hypothetical protein